MAHNYTIRPRRLSLMSGRHLLPTTGSSKAPEKTPKHNQKPPNPRGSKPKRIQIENACTSCRETKSRCDGIRPACSLCQALEKDCNYVSEEGESRWAALRRKNHILEAERDEARGLLALIQTRSETEAREIFRRIRINTYGDDAGALAQQIRDEIDAGTLLEQHQRREQQQQHILPTSIGSSAPGAGITLPPYLCGR